MFEATEPFIFFDYLRIPYAVTGGPGDRHTHWPSPTPHVSLQRLWPTQRGSGSATMYWPTWGARWFRNGSSSRPAMYRLRTSPVFGRIVPDVVSSKWRRETGGLWTPIERIVDTTGANVASVWRDQRGNILLPFDPGEIIHNYWSEAYQTMGRSTTARMLKSALLRAYYLAKPAIPRAHQIRLRQLLSSLQAKASFPRWPVEDALHDFYAWLFALVVDLAGTPVPWLDPWPHGYSWAIVLTHDVETEGGCANIELLRDVERPYGYRSSWNFVPERYGLDDQLLSRLSHEGCEVGVHGLRHDGRDLASRRLLRRRLPLMRAYAERWQAVGFRSPATQRSWELMPRLGFAYDSSYPDTDPYEPQAGGCCSLLPFMNRDLVELPITLPQDHTLFVILQGRYGDVWIEKAEHVKSRGGMALALTHPDYALDHRITEAYEGLLRHFRDDPSAWRPLPAEVSAWWKRRSQSSVEPTEQGGWAIAGPAEADGRIRLSERVKERPMSGGIPE